MSANVLAARLRASGVRRVAECEPMARHTSWRIGGPADVLCVVDDASQLDIAIRLANELNLPWLVLGGGNNILVADEGIEGLVLLNRLRGIAIEGSTEGEAASSSLRCGAGVFFARAAQYTAQRGFTGMEWGIAIPGTVGGGVVNNAGAHWSDVSRTLISADVIDATGRAETLTPTDLAYRYRQSALKTPRAVRSSLIVTAARFRLEPDDAVAALRRVEDLRRHRIQTQPVREASAGSTFKNPPGEHAGALIDRAGLKGYRIGGAQIAPLHANFILNVAGAGAADVIALIQLAQERVRSQFGIRLEPEVQFVGRWSDDVLQAVLDPAA